MSCRVLQVVTHMNRGGLETMLMNYYRHIDREKVQFDFLTHRSQDSAYDVEIRSLGGILYRLPPLNPFSSHYRKALSDFFAVHPEYRVIHVHQDCMSSVILKEAKRHGVSVRIAHSHNNNQDKNLKYPIKLVYRRLIPQYATHLFACSEEAGQWMFCGADFQVLHNAIDAAAYAYSPVKRKETRHLWGIKDDELLVGHVGRFSPQKNHMKLLQTFAAVCQKANARLMLVGDGELRPQMEAAVHKLELEDRVIFAGLRADVPELLQAIDVFILPSNYEGFGICVLEAQAAGLPCLISDRVPIECKKTDLVQQLPLDADAEVWADAVIVAADIERVNTYQDICAAGFDIRENAEKLQNFYLRAAAGEENVCLY